MPNKTIIWAADSFKYILALVDHSKTMAASELIRPGDKKSFADEIEPNLLTPMNEMILSLTKRIKMTGKCQNFFSKWSNKIFYDFLFSDEGGKFLAKLAQGADAQEEHIVWGFCGCTLLLIIVYTVNIFREGCVRHLVWQWILQIKEESA